MNGYNFTERVRKVLAMSREEAFRLHHEYVGTEHILLGLIREGEGVAAAVLQSLSVDLEEVRQNIEKTVNKGKSGQPTGDLPYTSRAKKVLELAMSEARELNHSYVGTEHLLLGLLREEKGIGAQVLKDAGLDLPVSRQEVLRLLGTEVPPGEAARSRGAASRASRHDAIVDQASLDRLLSRCSTRLQDVIRVATTEARTVWQVEAHGEHLLMALLHQDDGLAALILQRHHVNVQALRDKLSAELEQIQSEEPDDQALARSASEALLLAGDEAGRSRASAVGTDHLLLGLVRSNHGAAPRLLHESGVTADSVRRERAQIVG